MLKQEIVEATRVALESLRASLTQLLGDWIIEFIDISKLRNVIKKDRDYVEVIKKLFAEYSIISPNIEETSSEDLQKKHRTSHS
jgi:transcriptional antiterminator